MPPHPFRLRGLLVVLAALLVPPLAAQAQTQEQLGRFQLAERYLRAGQFERALPLLEDLHAQSPGTQVFYDRLKDAYEQSKRYDEALALVDGRLETQRLPVLMAERARLLYLRGDEQAAFDAYDEALALAPEARSTYLVVYHSLTQNRLFTRAIDVLERGREAMGDDEPFQSALAQLYSLTGRHEEAMREYVAWLRGDARKLGLVRSRVAGFVESEEARRAYTAVLRRAVEDEPLYRPFRELLAWLYVEGERYREALDVVRAIDRLEGERGAALFEFAGRVGHAGAYDVASDAYREILERYPNAAVAPEALLGLGIMHQRRAEQYGERPEPAAPPDTAATPQYHAALDAYRTFLERHPHHERYPDVLRRIGTLQQDVFFRLDEAEAALREVVRRYPATEAAREARFDLGRVALMRGRLDEARLAFDRLVEELRTGELAERARFELALLHFYGGAFESALGLADVLDANTSTDVANDAIELKVLIAENRGPDSLDAALQRYAVARLLQRRHQPTTALDTLDALLADQGRHPLADDARFLRAHALYEAGRPEQALAAWLELPLIHPRSPLADRSLFHAAQLQERTLDAPDDALATYTRLLIEHPGSLLVPDARARIRALRGDEAS